MAASSANFPNAGEVVEYDPLVALDRMREENARLRKERDEARVALAKIVMCIETSADDSRAPEAARVSMMAQVCKVLLNTTQVHEARRLLGRVPAGEPR